MSSYSSIKATFYELNHVTFVYIDYLHLNWKKKKSISGPGLGLFITHSDVKTNVLTSGVHFA